MRLRSRYFDRFHAPVPGVFPLEAEVQATLHPAYVIEHRTPDGVWSLHSRYGSDEAQALGRARWWSRLCRGRRQFRVCCVVGESSCVVMGEGAGHA